MEGREQELSSEEPLIVRILRIFNIEFLWNYNAFLKIIIKIRKQLKCFLCRCHTLSKCYPSWIQGPFWIPRRCLIFFTLLFTLSSAIYIPCLPVPIYLWCTGSQGTYKNKKRKRSSVGKIYKVEIAIEQTANLM